MSIKFLVELAKCTEFSTQKNDIISAQVQSVVKAFESDNSSALKLAISNKIKYPNEGYVAPY